MSQNISELQQVIQQQARELQELRVEIESLKRMMFEHRPAFIPAFNAVREQVRRGEAMPNADCRVPNGHNCG